MDDRFKDLAASHCEPDLDAQLVLSDWGEGEESAAGSSWILERSVDRMGLGRLPWESILWKLQMLPPPPPSLVSAHMGLP